jgi:hypothetical protein
MVFLKTAVDGHGLVELFHLRQEECLGVMAEAACVLANGEEHA